MDAQREDIENSADDDAVGGFTKAAIPAAIVVAAAVVASQLPASQAFIHETMSKLDVNSLLAGVSSRIENEGAMGFVYFALLYIGLEVLALPVAPMTASAGYFFGTVPGTIVVLISATIAAGVGFILGRMFLRDRFKTFIDGNDTFKKIDAAIGRDGFRVILLLRLSPLFPLALSNYLYGLTSVPFDQYFAATALGFIPGTIAYVYSGHMTKELNFGNGGAIEGASAWYLAAAILAFIAAASKVIADIAYDALSTIDDEGQ